MQIPSHAETLLLLLLSHPRCGMATGGDASGGDGTASGNSPGSAGLGVASPWVEGHDVSRGCTGKACICWGSRRRACCLGVLGITGFYLPFSSPLAAWIAGVVWSVGQCSAVGCDPQFLTSRHWDAAEAKAAAALLISQGPRRIWADGCGFHCFLRSILCPSVSPAAPPARAPAFTPWEVCAALGM